MDNGRIYRKKCITITVERIIEKDIFEIEVLYIKKIINNTNSWDIVVNYVKNNRKIKEICSLYPDAYIKIHKKKYAQEEIF